MDILGFSIILSFILGFAIWILMVFDMPLELGILKNNKRWIISAIIALVMFGWCLFGIFYFNK